MGILNRTTDGQLTVLLALTRTLQAYGPMPDERLEAFCTPTSVDQDRAQVRKTLLRFKQLGLFVDEARGLQLATPFDGLDLADIESVRQPLRSLILDDRNNPLDRDRADDDNDESGDATDFSLAAAWLLHQNPYTFSASWSDVENLQNEQLEPQLGEAPQEKEKKRSKKSGRFLSNSSRWDGLKEWAAFLGICRKIGDALVPNPVHSIRHALGTISSEGEQLPMRTFSAKLAGVIPVVDHGRYWKAAATRVSKPWLKLEPTDISPSLSLALLQLEHERRLAFQRRSDAPETFRLLGHEGRELQQVTHVSLVMEPSR